MFDVHTIVQTGGLLAVAAIIFAESGILLGLILPGDTLLLTAGLLAGQGKLPIVWLIGTVIISAIAGYEVGYIFGARVGPKVFKRKNGILFREEYVDRTRGYFEKYGPITIVLARFIAHIRTLVSIIAGTGNMNRRTYFIYNVIGAVLWGGGITMLGYWLGSRVPNVDKYFFPVIIAGLIAIYIVVVWELFRDPRRRHGLAKGLKEDFDYFVRGKDT
jgi:membrane-associated protein